MKRIVLAYSGDVISSAAIPWLARQHDAEIVTVTVDVGQQRELAATRERALALGAVRAHVIDAREEFVRDYLLPALQAGVLNDGHALARPLVAKRLVDVARMESAAAVAHGGLDGAAMHVATTMLAAPSFGVIVPRREWSMSDEELAAFARAQGVHVPSAHPFRAQASLWGRVLTAGAGNPVPEDAFTLTRAPEECPDEAALIDVEFAAGVPIRANDVEMSMIELIESLETIAGAHGVGRSQRGDAAVEAPAATVLDVAHRELETYVAGQDLARIKAQLSRIYAEALLSGRWFSDIREGIDAFAGVIQRRVTGTVRLRLLKGECTVVSRLSANAASRSADAATASKVTA